MTPRRLGKPLTAKAHAEETPPDAQDERVIAESRQRATGDSNVGMVKDSVETFVTQVVNIVVGLVSSIILSRTLNPVGKGLLQILILIPKSAWTFGTLGLDQVNTVFAGKEPHRRHELANTTLLIGLGVSILATAIVALMIYWPGYGAAKSGLLPGDFITAINGNPIDEVARGETPFEGLLQGRPSVTATIFRHGNTFDVEIPIENRRNGNIAKIEQEFSLSPLTKWRYGMAAAPLYAELDWYPQLNIGAIPLTPARWTDIQTRKVRDLFYQGAEIPEEQPALLVTQVGESGRLARLRNFGQKRIDLRPGDIITSVNGKKLPSPAGNSPEIPETELAGGSVTLEYYRQGRLRTTQIPIREFTPPEGFEGHFASVELGGIPPLLRRYGLLQNLAWEQQITIPNLGMAMSPMTDDRWQDLEARKNLDAFAGGTILPDNNPPALLVTEVHYPFLRKWAIDLPPALFMTMMLFFPLTVTAYLMDSILYGLNLIRLKNEKTVLTSIALAVMYLLVLYLYATRQQGLTFRNYNHLMTLMWYTTAITLIHGLFIQVYSYILIRTRAKFGWQYINFKYVFECFDVIGWRSYIANTASYLFYDIDVLIIKYMIEEWHTTMTLDNLGNYTQATNIIERVWIVPGAIATALLPKITNFGVAKAGELTPKSVRHTLVLTFAILIPLTIALPYLVPILWGEAFLPLMGPYYFLMPGILLFSMSKVFSSHLLGIGKPEYAMRYSVLTVVVNVVMNFILIPMKLQVGGIPIGGINGAALASTVAYTMHSLLMMSAYVKESGVPPSEIFRYTRDDWTMYQRGAASVLHMGKQLITGKVRISR